MKFYCFNIHKKHWTRLETGANCISYYVVYGMDLPTKDNKTEWTLTPFLT